MPPGSGGAEKAGPKRQEPRPISPVRDVDADEAAPKRRRLRSKTTKPTWDSECFVDPDAPEAPLDAEELRQEGHSHLQAEENESLPQPPLKHRRLRAKTTDLGWAVTGDATHDGAAAATSCTDEVEVQALDENHRAAAAVEAADEGQDDKAGEADTEEKIALAVLAAAMDGNAKQPRLVDLSSGTVYQLPRDGVFVIGRRYDCDLVIQEQNVSSRHCVLYCSGGGAKIEDLSTNGTFVNDTRVPKGFTLPQHVALMEGDHVTLAHRGGPCLLFVPPSLLAGT